MAVCPICGCKTEDIDMVKSNCLGVEKTICSFCDRQLHSIDEKDQITGAEFRWLTAVNEKEVPQRDEETAKALNELYNDYNIEEQEAAPKSNPAPIQNTAVMAGSVRDFPLQAPPKPTVIENKDEVINQLNIRVENLEKEIANMKRKQIIKSIIELGVPIILLIIILIVFFSSGLFDALANIYDEFVV